MEVSPIPDTVVIFGALGDLANRKLIPSLFNLHRRGLFHEKSTIVACGRAPMEQDAYRETVRKLLSEKNPPDRQELIETFLKKLFYHAGDYGEDDTYTRLDTQLKEIEHSFSNDNACRIYYLHSADRLPDGGESSLSGGFAGGGPRDQYAVAACGHRKAVRTRS